LVEPAHCGWPAGDFLLLLSVSSFFLCAWKWEQPASGISLRPLQLQNKVLHHHTKEKNSRDTRQPHFKPDGHWMESLPGRGGLKVGPQSRHSRRPTHCHPPSTPPSFPPWPLRTVYVGTYLDTYMLVCHFGLRALLLR
jgi:hypothetical protein